MNLDFYEQYRNYSNSDLLKIIKQPQSYQPEAVDAATQILSYRNILTEEIDSVDQYFKNLEIEKIARQEKINSYRDIAKV